MYVERWRAIPNYDGQYLISDLGRVRSLKTNKMLSPDMHSDGFKRIRLYKQNRVKRCLIHQLVAEAFIPNLNNFPCVIHKDGNKINNFVGNLKWGTQRSVVRFAWRSGVSTAHKTGSVKVFQYLGTELIRVFPSVIVAAKSVRRSTRTIERALNGDFKTAAGYEWRYEKKEGDLIGKS